MRTALLVCILLLPSACLATAPWIAADWAGKEPQFPPGSLFWMTSQYKTCAVLYRTAVEVKKGAIDYAGLRARSSWYGYLFVNGTEVARYEQTGEGAVTNLYTLDLTEHLKPGRNVLTMSTTGDGFSLEGHIRYKDGSSQPLLSAPDRWKVQKLAPLTMLEYEPCMKPDFDDSGWFAVKELAKESVTCSTQEAADLCAEAKTKRLQALDEDAQWRLQMLAEKGIAIVDWEAHGWAGAERLPPWVRELAGPQAVDREPAPGEQHLRAEALTRYVLLSDEATNLENQAKGLEALAPPRADSLACKQSARAMRTALAQMETALKAHQFEQALAAADKAQAASAAAHRRRILNELNWCLDNKFGWFDNYSLLDNDIAKWGLRVNPIEVSWYMNLDGKWRFKTDPNNTGLEEKRQSFGYNIENQWQELDVPGSWEKQGVQQDNPNHIAQSPYPGANVRSDGPYNGWAWYRKTLRVPQEWAGYDLELHVSAIDDWDWTYFNGQEIGHTGADTENWWVVPRAYKIPKDLVQFGGYNVIAFRIYDCGDQGILGSVELRCPGLKQAYETKPKQERRPTTVFTSPLSPAALLTVGEKELVIWGWEQRGIQGPNAMYAVVDDKVTTLRPDADGVVYDRARDGKLSENWVLLTSSAPGEKPIQLVLLQHPVRIAFQQGGKGTSEMVITFDQPGAGLLALRPEPIAVAATNVPDIEPYRFWSRALLSYPVTFSEAFIRDPQSQWALRVCDVYNYWNLKDDWGTQPLKIAPLPPLASYGLKTSYPGLEVTNKTQHNLHWLGQWGEFHAAVGQDYIVYRVPLDPIKRFGGFTSFCFGPTDIGEPGSIKEIETIKRTGSNSYRPQHNQNGDRAMKTLQWCWEQGIQNMFNCDGTYAAQDTIFEHYRKLAEQCKDYPPDAVAYDLINEPANMTPEFYNPRVKELTRIIREIDRTHLIYVETPHSFASISQFVNLEPTGDALTCYSFHDYDYRLPPRWPQRDLDIRNLLAQWIPAFKYSIDHRCPIHLGEFGGFEQTQQSVYDNHCAITVLSDMLRIFDQFGWHWNYYANRGVVRQRADGSLEEGLVQEAYRRYFARGTFNLNRPTTATAGNR